MKKVLFIDRDGTLVLEPPVDYQLDSLEKLEYFPEVFYYLGKIVREMDYQLVMVTNQDGLGTDSFPEDTFWPAQNKVIQAFKNEGIEFYDIRIDTSFEKDNSPNRKPRTGMLEMYMKGEYDLKNSFVIGDRKTDIQLAQNMGCQGIFIGEDCEEADFKSQNWKEIYEFLQSQSRRSRLVRNTNETKIEIELNLDGSGKSNIETGIGFFDHMLDQIAKHGKVDLDLKAKGDLFIDEHHTIEDIGLALGSAFKNALGTKKGIARYAFVLPMDECLAQVALDFGGRPQLVWSADFSSDKVGEMSTSMAEHFFKSFSDTALCNINMKVEGDNDHHKIESLFKAFAKCIKMAVKQENDFEIPSTKGTL
ncbi:MAG: imidazoleglycerol-phosphate dehydratase/histidinol-phosphatase [Lentimonas sp.]|jgi:imidazoleglycerol-phosphate dehydratase/histidinol-phosphatase